MPKTPFWDQISRRCFWKTTVSPETSSQNSPRGAKGAQDEPRWLQVGSKPAQEGPKTAQDGPKTAQDGPRGRGDGPRWPRDGPRGLQDDSRDLQDVRKDSPKTPEETKIIEKPLFFQCFLHVGKIAYKMQLDLKNDQLGTNLGPTWSQFVPKMEPRRAKMEPRRGKLEPSWANLGQLGPKLSPC